MSAPPPTSWRTGPLCGFDLETTGIDAEVARIVQWAVVVDAGTGRQDHAGGLVDPGVPIPPGASAVHGVTDEVVRERGAAPTAALGELRSRLGRAVEASVPIVGMNICYDLTVFDRELRRHGLRPLDLEHAAVIDALVLDRAVNKYRKGRRTLSDLASHYDVAAGTAHDAGGDVRTTLAVVREIGRRYPELPGDALALTTWQITAHKAWAENFENFLRRQGRSEVVRRDWPLVTTYDAPMQLPAPPCNSPSQIPGHTQGILGRCI